tara:strand:+ start:127 stop:984 length:858 start_codon:yes stop_codon:yes gene_type:complete
MNEAEKRIKRISNSGASFSIERNPSGAHILIKTIVSDITRSQVNINKQKNQERLQGDGYYVQAVPIFSESVGLDDYVVKMAYIDGISADKFVVRGSRKTAQQLKKSLGLYLGRIIDDSHLEEIESQLFIDKAAAVLDATNCPYLKTELKGCFDILQDICKKNYYFPVGKCHGDLTLSNVIMSNDDTLNLIDYLDTFFESPLQDVAKIMQDFIYGWSFRYEKESASLSALIFCLHSTPLIFEDIVNKFRPQIKILLILTLMRIAPYTDDEVTRNWLIKALRKESVR